MHMADALLSPAVGGIFWLGSAALIGYSAKKISMEDDMTKTPLMGVMGAFIFAAQMVNFSIPATGSSGHIGGGLLLTVMLGPWRAFVTLASVLVVQSLFFADGGLLALGCNIFNLAFFPAFVACPLVFRKVAGNGRNSARLMTGSVLAAIVGLETGAFSVVIQTILSGNSDLPFRIFVTFMLPIHLAIGAVEGIVTWAVLAFLIRVQPVLVSGESHHAIFKPLPAILATTALVIGGVVSYFASEQPDGLEWSVLKTIGKESVERKPSRVGSLSEAVRGRCSFLPDYNFKPGADTSTSPMKGLQAFGTSVSGITGVSIGLLFAFFAGLALRNRDRGKEKRT